MKSLLHRSLVVFGLGTLALVMPALAEEHGSSETAHPSHAESSQAGEHAAEHAAKHEAEHPGEHGEGHGHEAAEALFHPSLGLSYFPTTIRSSGPAFSGNVNQFRINLEMPVYPDIEIGADASLPLSRVGGYMDDTRVNNLTYTDVALFLNVRTSIFDPKPHHKESPLAFVVAEKSSRMSGASTLDGSSVTLAQHGFGAGMTYSNHLCDKVSYNAFAIAYPNETGTTRSRAFTLGAGLHYHIQKGLSASLGYVGESEVDKVVPGTIKWSGIHAGISYHF